MTDRGWEAKVENPWSTIALRDYEMHMASGEVRQLQALDEIMLGQFYRYPAKTLMILGVAGGNGLRHIDPGRIETVYGVDLNASFLQECAERYGTLLEGAFHPILADLMDPHLTLPHADLLVADLLIEYIGYECFAGVVGNVQPLCLSCVIQVNPDTGGFVSESPYLHAFDRLEEVHHQIREEKLTESLRRAGYRPVFRAEQPLPNGKRFVCRDYRRNSNAPDADR